MVMLIQAEFKEIVPVKTNKLELGPQEGPVPGGVSLAPREIGETNPSLAPRTPALFRSVPSLGLQICPS